MKHRCCYLDPIPTTQRFPHTTEQGTFSFQFQDHIGHQKIIPTTELNNNACFSNPMKLQIYGRQNSPCTFFLFLFDVGVTCNTL